MCLLKCFLYNENLSAAADYRQEDREPLLLSLLHIWIFLAALREINVLLFLLLSSALDKAATAAAASVQIIQIARCFSQCCCRDVRIYTTERNKSS